MKLLAVMRKCLREQRREMGILVMTLITAPFFVLLYRFAFGAEMATYSILVANRDAGRGGAAIVQAMADVRYKDGAPMLAVTAVADLAAARSKLQNRAATLLVVIPPDFSRSLEAALQGAGDPAPLEFEGDLTNPRYTVAAVFTFAAVEQYLAGATGVRSPVKLVETALGSSDSLREFEVYIPGLVVFAVIMLIYPAAMAAAREVETGTLRRLQGTSMTALDFLGGISAVQVIIGMASMLLTLLTARLVGFQMLGSYALALAVGTVAALAMVGVGLVVASFSRTVTEAFVIGTFPMMLMMFFSGSIYPVAPAPLFTAGSHTISLYDVLPATHAVGALNKVFIFGSGPHDVLYELTALALLSMLYLGAGVGLFRRMRM